MYKIKVKAKKHWPECTKNSVELIVNWAVKELDLDVSPVPIHIHLKGPADRWGDCIDLDTKVVVRIFFSDLWMQTIFHELEHARQYVYGELQLEHDHAIWKGKLIERIEDRYYEDPWEVQAREVEDKMEIKFLTFIAPALIMNT